MFLFEGLFNCANAYIRQGSSEIDFSKSPIAQTYTISHYLSTNLSPVQGEVSLFSYLFQEESERNRNVYVVNFKTTGDIIGTLPDGEVVYLGGRHEKLILQISGENMKERKNIATQQ